MYVQVCMYCIHVYIHLHVVYTAHTYRISIKIGDKGNNKYRFSSKPEAKYCIKLKGDTNFSETSLFSMSFIILTVLCYHNRVRPGSSPRWVSGFQMPIGT